MKQADKIERQGNGIHYSNDGTEFSGVWVDDKMNGEGTALVLHGQAVFPFVFVVVEKSLHRNLDP